MRRNLLHTIWVAAAVLLAASCEREELPGVGADGTQTLAITVTDGGYAPADRNGGSPAGAPQTRAVENGYTTRFTVDDACGLYIVRGGELAYANVKLTATAATGGTLTWQPEAGVTLTGGFNGEAYYLYYPYQADMIGKTASVPTADMSDAVFFDPLIRDWMPKADQSIYTTGYTASDLMTATGTANKNGKTIALSFSMAHRMALAVIELPKTKYVFSNTPGIPDYTVPTSVDFTESQAKPYRMADGTYRYIVHPKAATAPEITGSYAGGSKKFTFNPTAITAASYKTYKIDGGTSATPLTIPYTLQVGDYFCSSGNASGWYIIPKELAPTESDNCIGIVLKAGRDFESSWTDNCDYKFKGSTTFMSEVHGYVLALRDANGGCPWGSYGTEVGCDRNQTTGFYGYSSTQTIVAFNKDKNWNLSDAFPAVYHATNYETVCSAPDNTSGWFLPSGGQCQYWLNHRDVILRSIQNAGGDGWKNWYWTSSEYSRNPVYFACHMSMYDDLMGNDRKFESYAVRAWLAF